MPMQGIAAMNPGQSILLGTREEEFKEINNFSPSACISKVEALKKY